MGLSLSLSLSLSLFLLVSFQSVPQRAWAQVQGTCIENTTPSNTNGLKKYRVNTSLIHNFSGLDADTAIGSTMLGADQWNEYGNAGYFQYIGSSSLEDIPTGATACAQNDIDYSLVHFTTTCGAAGQMFSRCGGSQFLVLIRKNDSSCTPFTFGNGATSGSLDYDLPALFAHEFGHPQGLGNVGASEAATLGGGQSIAPETQRRQLYEYDFKCTAEDSGIRSLTAYRRYHNSTGTFSSATAFKSGVTKAHAGFASGTNWGAAFHRGSAVSWDQGINGSYTDLTNPSPINGIGFTPGFWRETPSTDRVFYSYWDDSPTDYDWDSTHLVRQIRSTNGFSTQNADYLYHCTSMTGFMNCSNYALVRSPGNLATAFIEAGTHQRSVVAWLHHDRDYTNTSANEIKIAIGSVTDDRLSLPMNTGIRSAIPPGVACKNDFSGSYDCVLIYVPIEDLELKIVSRRFQIGVSGTHYVTLFDPTLYPFPDTSRASAPVAVWWNAGQGEFYAAWRRAAANQTIGVRRSSTGTSWTWVSSNVDTSYVAPSAASQWAGSSNVLVYAK